MVNVVVGDQQYEVPERVARMIVWLVAHAAQLCRERVKLTFHCAGRKICTELVEGGEA